MVKRDDKRTTISLAQVVWGMAEEMMAAKGFNDNFSAYVADLVRRDKERAEAARPATPMALVDRPALNEIGPPVTATGSAPVKYGVSPNSKTPFVVEAVADAIASEIHSSTGRATKPRRSLNRAQRSISESDPIAKPLP